MKDDELKLWVWGGVLALMVAVIAFTFFGGWSLIVGREFGKFAEESRRQIQEESRAYNEGMAQNIDRLCLEWERTSNPAIAQAIRHRTAGYKGEFPQHVQQCVDLARKVK
jgi:hypothetical protein